MKLIQPDSLSSLNQIFQNPYVRVHRDGKYLDKNGNIVPRTSDESHISLDDFNFNDLDIEGTSNKIHPSYIEHFQYYENEYGDIWPSLVELLESFALTRLGTEKPCEYVLNPMGYGETSHDFEYFQDMVQDALKGKIKNPLTLEQGKEFLRMNQLILMFDQVYNRESPDDPEEFRKFCLNHPLWYRLEKQAQKTLDSLRKK